MQGKYGNLDASVVSYGPCQTPTLNFCVERHQKIASFQPEPFWVVRPHVSKGGQSITLEWGRGRLFDMDIAQMFKKVVTDGQQLKVRTHSQSDQALLLDMMQSMVRHHATIFTAQYGFLTHMLYMDAAAHTADPYTHILQTT